MPDEIVLLISPEGVVTGLWNELAPWQELGVCSCQRASDVVWNHDAQSWDVILATGERIGSWPSRAEAVEHEIAYLQARL